MRDLIPLTDAEIEERFDALGVGLTTDGLAFTRDTLADFRAARANWAEPGSIDEDADGVLVIDRVQPRRGTPRRRIVVVDFGNVRAVYGANR